MRLKVTLFVEVPEPVTLGWVLRMIKDPFESRMSQVEIQKRLSMTWEETKVPAKEVE